MKFPEIKQGVNILDFFDIVKVEDKASKFVVFFDWALNLCDIETGGVNFVNFIDLLFVCYTAD